MRIADFTVVGFHGLLLGVLYHRLGVLGPLIFCHLGLFFHDLDQGLYQTD